MEEVCPSLALHFSLWLECRVTGWIPRKGMPHAEDGDVTGKNEPGILWCMKPAPDLLPPYEREISSLIVVLFLGGRGLLSHTAKKS